MEISEQGGITIKWESDRPQWWCQEELFTQEVSDIWNSRPKKMLRPVWVDEWEVDNCLKVRSHLTPMNGHVIEQINKGLIHFYS